MRSTFIPKQHRPIPIGAKLDEDVQAVNSMDANDCLFCIDQAESIVTICIGAKNDRVLQIIERNIIKKSQIKILFLEEMHESWSFICRDGKVRFVLQDNLYSNLVINPKLVYYRSAFCEPDSKYHFKLMEIVNLLELYTGEALCRPMEHRLNNSKLLQLCKTILPAIQQSELAVTIPPSYVVKGKKSFAKLKNNNLIVKSLSGVRSDVLDKQSYTKWDQSPISYMPVLFQQIATGTDLRIHVLNGRLFAKKIIKKQTGSYRYNTRSSQLEDFEINEALQAFCQHLSALENNTLSGIDLMQNPRGEYACFEVNPGPGWSAYHEDENVNNKKTFLSQIMECLKRGSIT